MRIFFWSGASEGGGCSGASGGKSAIFEIQNPDFAWKLVWTVQTNYEIFFWSGASQGGSQGHQGVTQPLFELQTPYFAWNFV